MRGMYATFFGLPAPFVFRVALCSPGGGLRLRRACGVAAAHRRAVRAPKLPCLHGDEGFSWGCVWRCRGRHMAGAQHGRSCSILLSRAHTVSSVKGP